MSNVTETKASAQDMPVDIASIQSTPLAGLDGENTEKDNLGNIEERSCTATEHVPEKWNNPRVNILRFLATLFCFLIMGANDASVGALIPYLEVYYDISYTIVALIFLSPVAGYTLSAFLINQMHMRFGQLGIAVAGPIFKLVAFVVTCVHPPFAVIPVVFCFAGFGSGLEDGAWNAWIGGLGDTSELMGLLHGAYGLGGTIGPLISTAMVTKGGLPWYAWYYVMVGGAILELLLCVFAFRNATGLQFRTLHPVMASDKSSRTRESLSYYVTYIVALFLFAYVGVEVALGGWIVTFMLQLRDGEPFASGQVATGFWAGLTAGRVLLGFVTGRIGEKLAIAIYLVLCITLELLFWLVNSFISSAIFAAFLGFFLGPLFPAAIVVATKLLPRRLHVSAIGFMGAFGSSGAAIFPFVVGAVAQAKGVWVLQPIALALIAIIFILWCSLPGGFRKAGMDRAQATVQKTGISASTSVTEA